MVQLRLLYSESTVLVVTNYHSCSYHSLYSSAVRGTPTQVPRVTGSLAKLSFDHVDIVLVVVVVIIDVEYVRTRFGAYSTTPSRVMIALGG